MSLPLAASTSAFLSCLALLFLLAAERGGVCRQFEQLAGVHRLTGPEGGAAQPRAKPHKLLFVSSLVCHRGAFLFALILLVVCRRVLPPRWGETGLRILCFLWTKC